MARCASDTLDFYNVGSVRRCAYIALAGAMMVWPLARRAQQAGVRVVGHLLGSDSHALRLAEFCDRLKNDIEDQNIAFERHGAQGNRI
jgi:hypothetical protein